MDSVFTMNKYYDTHLLLTNTCYNYDLAVDVLNLFKSELHETFDSVMVAVGEKNIADLNRITHTLKSTSHTVGALNIYRAVLDVREDLQHGIYPDDPLITKLVEEIKLGLKTIDRAICSIRVTDNEENENEEPLLDSEKVHILENVQSMVYQSHFLDKKQVELVDALSRELIPESDSILLKHYLKTFQYEKAMPVIQLMIDNLLFKIAESE